MENFELCGNLDVCLNFLQEDSKLAVAVSREHAINHQLNSFSPIYCFKRSETIYKYTLKFLMQKDFPYMNELNQFIRRVDAAGLIVKWHSDCNNPNFPKRKQKFYRQIKLQSFYGVFLIWFALQLLTLITFIFEKIIYKKLKAHRPSRFWIFADMFIDPERHFLLETKKF